MMESLQERSKHWPEGALAPVGESQGEWWKVPARALRAHQLGEEVDGERVRKVRFVGEKERGLGGSQAKDLQ